MIAAFLNHPLHDMLDARLPRYNLVPLLLQMGIAAWFGWSILPTGLAAQTQDRSWHAEMGVHAVGASTDMLPFWLRANQYGTIDSTSANGIVRASLARTFAPAENWHLTVATDVLARAARHPALFAHELYVRADYRALQLQAGRWEEAPTGLTHANLSLGAMSRSRNAPPLPKIVLGTPSYVPVPGVERALAVKGYLAHGWFTGDRFVRDALLHEKYVYLRFLAPSSPIQLHAGILQHTVWGGTHPTRGPLPQDIPAFLRVLGGQPGGSEAPTTDQKGTIGSTEAGYDFGITLQTAGLETHISRYFHHTDRPSLLFRNPWDGLWEVRVERASDQLVSTVLWEYLNATRHNAKYSEGEERGKDTYYNNSLYRGGWTHRGFTVGSPFLLPNPKGPGIANNIVVAHHLGLAGQIAPMWRYRVLATYSRHYGAQGVCADAACTQRVDRRTDRTDQYAARIEITRHVTDALRLRTAVATDLGALYPGRVGVLVGLSWQGAVATP